jgi:cytochrome c-type biogenesis protein CcmH
MLLRGRVLALLAIALATGCDKKPLPPSAPPSAALPPLDPSAAPAAPAGDRPTHAPTGGAGGMGGLPAGHPPLGGGGGGAGMGAHGQEQTTPGNIPFDKLTVVSGVLRLDDKLKAKVASGDVIYLVARNADAPGPPLAVKKLAVAGWPITFSLDSRDAMFEGTQMKGKIVVQARIDKDGDAATKTPGDVTGTSRAVELPADKVVITFDTVL